MSGRVVIARFDQHQFGRYPPPGTLVLRIVNFATIQIVGIDPRDMKPGYIAIGIALLGYSIRSTMDNDIHSLLELGPL
jgi:hypothetical protein